MPPANRPKPVKFKERTETSITVSWESEMNMKYRMEYKEPPHGWKDAISLDVGQCNEFTLEDLNPTCTYEIRIYARNFDGESEPSEPVAVDTEVPGCGSGPQCCMI